MSVKVLAFLDTSPQGGENRSAEQRWKELFWPPSDSALHPPMRHPGRLGFYDLDAADDAHRVVEEAKTAHLDGFVVPVGPEAPPIPAALIGTLSARFGLAFHWDNRGQKGADAIESVVAAMDCPFPILADGRPVLTVSDADALLPHIAHLRAVARRRGLPDLYLIGERAEDRGLTARGFDALLDPDPGAWHSVRRDVEPGGYELVEVLGGVLHPSFVRDNRFDYAQVIASRMVNRELRGRVLPRVFRGYFDWPDDPAAGATVLHNREEVTPPIMMEMFLEKAMCWTDRHFPDDQQLVFVDSWNDYRHGTEIEPCTQDGDLYLRTVRNGIDRGRFAIRIWPPLPGRIEDQARFEAIGNLARTLGLRQG